MQKRVTFHVAAIVTVVAMLLAMPRKAAAQELKDSLEHVSEVKASDLADSMGVSALLTPDTLSVGPQAPDTLTLDSASLDSIALRAQQQITNLRSQFKPEPKRALWLALVFPGGGQIYNRKYWKLPIIYGGFLGCYYALSWNNQMLRDYSQAYLDIMDDDPNTKSYEKMLPLNYDISGRESQFKEIFKNKKNYYRKYRDMSILAFIAVYAIGVIDAYVDAELSTFDISTDLSLQWAPTIINGNASDGLHPVAHPSQERNYGVALRLSF